MKQQPTLLNRRDVTRPLSLGIIQLRLWRSHNNFTIAQAASEIGISYKSYNKFEVGSRRPSREVAAIINKRTNNAVSVRSWCVKYKDPRSSEEIPYGPDAIKDFCDTLGLKPWNFDQLLGQHAYVRFIKKRQLPRLETAIRISEVTEGEVPVYYWPHLRKVPEVGIRLCSWRMQNGMSRKQFAALIRLDSGSVGSWEMGKNIPTWIHAQHIARITNNYISTDMWPIRLHNCSHSFPKSPPIWDDSVLKLTAYKFEQWLVSHYESYCSFANKIGYNTDTVMTWARGIKVPSCESRVVIEKATNGDIKFDDWGDDKPKVQYVIARNMAVESDDNDNTAWEHMQMVNTIQRIEHFKKLA
jgi:transcriptional regulator with XRE-family HTH domain/DNA-binding transcriptional regulator YdaS (Cro superfamily)